MNAISGRVKQAVVSMVAAPLLLGLWARPAAAVESEPPAICFAPGTPAERVAEVHARARASGTSLAVPGGPSEFRASTRWSATATNPGPLGQGAPMTLTWSIIPDGTFIPSGFSGDPAGGSTLVGRLNGLYGSPAVWLPLFQQVFDRWQVLTGITYVYQSTDDGAAFPNASGHLGVRGDVRIGGRSIDGNSGILAYNYFPNSGDMVIDAPDTFYNTTSSNSLRLRNVVSHEHGHGIALQHVCPINQTKLMEPFVSTAFDGPQHDDTLGGQRLYGDRRENNDAAGTATSLGSLPNGTTSLADVSTDNNVDADFYGFAVPAGKRAAVTMTPVGFTYLEGPQNPDGTCTPGGSFNSLILNDQAIQLLGTDGSTVLATANSSPAGSAETIPSTVLPGGGTFYVRAIPGATNQVQLYSLGITLGDAVFLSVGDVTLSEGNGGTTSFVFTVSLSAAAGQPVTVNFATANGTAIAPGDYTAQAGSLTFTPGVTTQTVTVPVVGDLTVEPNETFTLNLSGAVNASIADAQGVGTILNDDQPALSVNDVSLAEGNGGTGNLDFTLSLSAASTQTVTVNFFTTDGTAAGPGDYTPQSGAATFSPGVTTRTVSVPVVGDITVEPNETFNLNLSGAVNATIADALGVGTILNDDQTAASIDDVTVAEGNSGVTSFVFTLSLSAPHSQAVTVDFATADGTATQPGDYTLQTGTRTFAPGAMIQTVTVPVLGDTVVESSETFLVNLTGAVNAVLADAQGVGMIVNDDLPAASVNDVLATEGDSGTLNASFTVSLSQAAPFACSVNYGAVSGTATAGVDFGAVAGTVQFPAGVTTQPVLVPVFGDTINEPNETYFVNLSGPSGATVADGQGQGTIVDNDAAGLTISDFAVRERVPPSTATATFTVTLAPTSGGTVTVDWATADGTATAGSDYVTAGGTLTFNPGQAAQTVTVTVNADTVVEGVETFAVNLSGASGAAIADATGTGRILDPPAGADFDADNRTDLLWRHDVSGQNVLWFMNGANLITGTFTTPPTLSDVRWKMVGTNDFNADGKPDILWRHSFSGENVLWFMNGSVLTTGTFLTPSALADVRWGMSGTGDFNLDGKPDILWRHSTSGEIVVWFMNGSILTSGTFLTPPAFTDVNWQTVGTADFNSDGKTDILWRHALSGQNVVWFLDGTSMVGGAFTNPPALDDVRWRMVALGDYSFDGKVDIVWRHSFSGQNVLWFMNGIDLTGGAFTNPSLPDTGWKIVGPR